jgi:NAD(P) transhydrogenase subunit alpha
MELAPLLLLIFAFTLSVFLGFELISKVPSQLHTPLMSGSNAISGVTVVGALLALSEFEPMAAKWIGFFALILAMINVVGGYVVTDRMLGMFRKKEKGEPKA